MTLPYSLADFTSPALIAPALRSIEPRAVISELADLLHKAGNLHPVDGFCEAVIAREQMSPTAIPLGWALPHARLRDLQNLSFALGRSSSPLTWFGSSRAHVRLVFLFAVPDNQSKSYLDVVSAVARLTRQGALVEQMLAAEDAGSLLDLLRQAPLRPPVASATLMAGRPGR